jgi:hypothetical protein
LNGLNFEIREVNRFCAFTDKFVLAWCRPQSLERLQFIRGAGQLFIDLVARSAGLFSFIRKLCAIKS